MTEHVAAQIRASRALIAASRSGRLARTAGFAAPHPTGVAQMQAAANDSPVTAGLMTLQRAATARPGATHDRNGHRAQVSVSPPSRSGQSQLPVQLQAGIEQLSGLSMAGVNVHRNSAQPAKVGAHAYAQGRDIHLGPGQEKHLPHEAWHVVQQAQGRVKPTLQMKGVLVNDDAGLEREADVMGAKAMQASARMTSQIAVASSVAATHGQPLQLVWDWKKALAAAAAAAGTGLAVAGLVSLVAPAVALAGGLIGLGSLIAFLRMRGGEYARVADHLDDDAVFTDSDSDEEDPAFDGVRLVGADRNDRAEFDRIKLRRGKIYEDKLAEFDQSKTPERHRKPVGELIANWIQKQVLRKTRRKLDAIQSGENGLTVRDHEATGMSPEFLMQWFEETRRFKIVVSSDIPQLREALREAILDLRADYPDWTITAKMNDPRAREDHDRMH